MRWTKPGEQLFGPMTGPGCHFQKHVSSVVLPNGSAGRPAKVYIRTQNQPPAVLPPTHQPKALHVKRTRTPYLVTMTAGYNAVMACPGLGGLLGKEKGFRFTSYFTPYPSSPPDLLAQDSYRPFVAAASLIGRPDLILQLACCPCRYDKHTESDAGTRAIADRCSG